MGGAAAPVHLLTEERRGAFDAYRADRALAEIRRALEAAGAAVAVHGYHAADCDAAAVAEALETPSLFGARTLVVLRGAEALDERAQERLVGALERQAPQVVLAVVARGADMRRRFFARCRDLGRVVPVDHPRPGELPAFADRLARERGRRLDADARALLVESVGADLAVLAGELDKLAAAVPESRAIGIADVARVTAAARAHGNFEVADAVCARDAAGATRLLAQTLDEGAQPIALVGALASSLRPVLAGAELVARGQGPEQAARALGVAPYQRRAFLRGVQAYRPRELRRALGRLAEIDVASKTGAGDARALLEEWVLRVCLRRRAARPATASPGR
jgi:DNA polymerase-3 subunit delta